MALAAAGGCQRTTEEPASRTGRGVKVPLADGWSARPGQEQSLSVGPPGRAVLRIDPRPGAAASRPDAGALLGLFSASFSTSTLIVLSSQEEDGYSSVTLRLGARDGGAGEAVLLGAKAVGQDLFLCATVPGATEAEVASAARACQGISYPEGP